MILVGICDDHGASCAISINRKIVYAAGEERFSRIKNDSGFPLQALQKGFELLKITANDVDMFLFSETDRTDFTAYEYRRESLLNVKDHQRLMKEYWEPKLAGFNYPVMLPINILKEKRDFKKGFYGIPIERANKEWSNQKYQNISKSAIANHFKVPEERIGFLDHHACHAYYAISTSKNPLPKDFAVITVDSWGDGKNQTVWKRKGNKLILLAESSSCLLARIYRFTTLYLGMKPNEHEYKVMGLSAYPDTNHSSDILTSLKKLVEVKGLKIICPIDIQNLYRYLSDIYSGHRFDNIARAAQDLVENSLVALFENVAQELSINNFYYTGGVAMNVKANQKILSSDLVNSLVVPGAPDDQSNSIGACLLYQSIQDGKLPSNLTDNMYLGEGIEPIDESDIKRFCDKESVHIVKTITPGQVADILISGEIVARASGNMEFGARALGNRSIFALPSDWDSVDRINYLIKQRDFWMPFAGSVIEEDANFILEGDWKKGDARFMTISFPAKLEHYHKFKAATHRKDKSIRIHVVLKEENPWYYEMLLSIKKRLGLGVILNTSFNLHGYPIVRTKQDALEIFYATNIKHLVLGDSLLSKLNPISQ